MGRSAGVGASAGSGEQGTTEASAENSPVDLRAWGVNSGIPRLRLRLRHRQGRCQKTLRGRRDPPKLRSSEVSKLPRFVTCAANPLRTGRSLRAWGCSQTRGVPAGVFAARTHGVNVRLNCVAPCARVLPPPPSRVAPSKRTQLRGPHTVHRPPRTCRVWVAPRRTQAFKDSRAQACPWTTSDHSCATRCPFSGRAVALRDAGCGAESTAAFC